MMNDTIEYYDISGKTAPLIIIDMLDQTSTTAEMRQRARAALFAMRGIAYINADTGWSITIGRNGIDKTLSESGRTEHFQALAKLPELLANAVLVRRKANQKIRSTVTAYYRMYAPIEVGGNMFAAQITIKENSDGGRGFYVQRLQIKEPAVTRGASAAHARAVTLQQAGSPVSIPRLLRDVKSEDAPPDEVT